MSAVEAGTSLCHPVRRRTVAAGDVVADGDEVRRCTSAIFSSRSATGTRSGEG